MIIHSFWCFYSSLSLLCLYYFAECINFTSWNYIRSTPTSNKLNGIYENLIFSLTLESANIDFEMLLPVSKVPTSQNHIFSPVLFFNCLLECTIGLYDNFFLIIPKITPAEQFCRLWFHVSLIFCPSYICKYLLSI